jgi:hypothetical protein
MFLGVIGCGVGMFVYGYMLETQASIYVCSFFWGWMMFGVLVAGISSMSYALDSFRESSNELFIMNMLFKVTYLRSAVLTLKNFMFYGLSNFANPWVEANGPGQILYVFGGTSVFLCLLACPVWIYGKRLRSWWARHNVFHMLGMQTTGPVALVG